MNTAILSLNAALALAAFWLAWHFGWRQLRLDKLRQELFQLRDELFLMAARRENGLTFDSEVYGVLRRTFNLRIRYAHQFTSLHALISVPVLLAFRINPLHLKTATPADQAIAAIKDEKLKAALLDIEARSGRRMLSYLATTSPFVLSLLVLSFLGVIVYALFLGIIASCRQLKHLMPKDDGCNVIYASASRAVYCHADKEARTARVTTDMFAEALGV